MNVMFVIFDLLIFGTFVRHVTYFSSFPITIVTVFFKSFIFNVFFGFLLFSSSLSLLFCILIIIAVFFFLLLFIIVTVTIHFIFGLVKVTTIMYFETVVGLLATFLFALLIVLIVKFVIIGSLIGVKVFSHVLSPATQNFITLSKSLFGFIVI